MTPMQRRMQPPSVRVRGALNRLSRDRWLPGRYVFDVANRLAECCSFRGRSAQVAYAAASETCFMVGMLRGKPAANTWDPFYREFVRALGGIEKPARDARHELKILQLTLRGLA